MITVDDTGWPIVHLHLSGPQTMTDLNTYLTALGSCLAREQPFAGLSTSHKVARAEPGTAKAQMAWIAEHAEELRAHLVGMASVVDAADLQRFQACNAKLAAHIPFPTTVYATETECADWLHHRLAERSEPEDHRP